MLKVLDGGLEEVAPLLVVGPARLQAPAAPRHAVAARTVPQRFLTKYIREIQHIVFTMNETSGLTRLKAFN